MPPCPIVHTLQERIKRAWINASKEGGQVVIYGKEGHAEVVGLMGQINGEAILISDESDLHKIDFTKSVFLFSQTTKSKSGYENLIKLIRNEIEKTADGNSKVTFKVFNTICGQVSRREPKLREFSRKHEVIIFVSGKGSSNGRMLFSVCLSENSRCHFISSPSELNPEWFRDVTSVGICGATSTPKWLIYEVASAAGKM